MINSSAPENYYLTNDIEKRQKDVNGYIGNFMILDAGDNNHKNNKPLKDALKYYKGIETSWLVEDIECMIHDDEYFDIDKNIPKESFFIERTKRLKNYFKGILDRELGQEEVTIEFD